MRSAVACFVVGRPPNASNDGEAVPKSGSNGPQSLGSSGRADVKKPLVSRRRPP
jgi:hypothetical protein